MTKIVSVQWTVDSKAELQKKKKKKKKNTRDISLIFRTGLFQIPLSKSEVFLEETLEKLCDRMPNWGVLVDKGMHTVFIVLLQPTLSNMQVFLLPWYDDHHLSNRT